MTTPEPQNDGDHNEPGDTPDRQYIYRFELASPRPNTVAWALSHLDRVRTPETLDAADHEDTDRITFYWLESSPVTAQEVEAQVALYLSLLPGVDVHGDGHGIFTGESPRDTWREARSTTRVTPRLRVDPPWADGEAPTEGISLTVDPTTAFGTGTHETTQLSALSLEEALDDRESVGSVLDVGCGSGILAMLAARSGANRVLGLDIDRETVEQARSNVRANGLSESVEVSTRPLEDVDDHFDLVVANIITPTLLDRRDALVARVRPGGGLVLGGLNAAHDDAFAAEFFDDEWKVESIRRKRTWSALRARRIETNTLTG